MNTLKYICSCFFAILISCNPGKDFQKVDRLPVLIHQEPLPPVPHDLKTKSFKLNTRMIVSEEGNVIDVELLSHSSNSTWDSLAVEKLKQWVFTPAISQNAPIKIRIRQPIIISVKDPLNLDLSEIVFDNAEIAFKVYDSLKNGNNFSKLVESYSTADSKHDHGKIGNVNIREMDPEIQTYFESLNNNDYTKPILYKGKYTIFKRINSAN